LSSAVSHDVAKKIRQPRGTIMGQSPTEFPLAYCAMARSALWPMVFLEFVRGSFDRFVRRLESATVDGKSSCGECRGRNFDVEP
jgi:hypothetical protein